MATRKAFEVGKVYVDEWIARRKENFKKRENI
jgi:hypothetical protein